DERGTYVGNGALVWTATKPDGTLSDTNRDCSDWTYNAYNLFAAGDVGQTDFSDNRWIEKTPYDQYCYGLAHLYCISQSTAHLLESPHALSSPHAGQVARTSGRGPQAPSAGGEGAGRPVGVAGIPFGTV